MFHEYDQVTAKKDLNKKVIKGMIGTIVMVYSTPHIGYEVEFFDEHSNTIDILTVSENDILLNRPYKSF